MPGISLYFTKDSHKEQIENHFAKSPNNSIDTNPLSRSKMFELDKYLTLYKLAYNSYHIERYETNELIIAIEGKFYGSSSTTFIQQIEKLTSYIRKDSFTALTDFITETDGEFIVYIYDKVTNKSYLFNDSFGRLPLYYYEDNQKLCLSRDQFEIVELCNAREIDKYGAAIFSLFTFTVDKLTLIKDINYFLPGTFLSIDHNSNQWFIKDIFKYNFELMNSNKKLNKETMSQLVDLFKSATRDRQTEKTLIGLSGGFDSRAIAGAFDLRKEVLGVSRLSPNGREKRDTELAQELANSLNLPFDLIKTKMANETDLADLLSLKSGINTLENIHNIAYEKQLFNTYGSNFNYLTGDGGDRIKPSMKFDKTISSIDSLAEFVLLNNSLLNISTITELYGINKNELLHIISNYLHSLPENDLKYKLAHFQIYDSAFKYVFEGEDRKRSFFWATTPFYSPQFFNLAMSIREKDKAKMKLYIGLLNSINPILSNIKIAGWEVRPTTTNMQMIYFLYFVKNNLPKTLIKKIRPERKKVKSRAIPFVEDFVINHIDKFKRNETFNFDYFKSEIIKGNINNSRILDLFTPMFLQSKLNK